MVAMTRLIEIAIYDDELISVFGPCRRQKEWNRVRAWIHDANRKTNQIGIRLIALSRFVNGLGKELRRQRYIVVEAVSKEDLGRFAESLIGGRGFIQRKIGKLINSKLFSGQEKQLCWPEEWLAAGGGA